MMLLKLVLRSLCMPFSTMVRVIVIRMKVSLWGAHHQSEGAPTPGPAGERGLRMRSRGERESWELLEKGSGASQHGQRISDGERKGG